MGRQLPFILTCIGAASRRGRTFVAASESKQGRKTRLGQSSGAPMANHCIPRGDDMGHEATDLYWRPRSWLAAGLSLFRCCS